MPAHRPPRRPLSPWVPVLLVSLTLLTLIAGLSVGTFYWNDLRPDTGRIGANLAQVRDRQRVMMGNFAEAQALLLEQQRHLVAQAQDLRRREQALYDARLEINAQRDQLAQAVQAEANRQKLAARDGGHVGNAGAVPDLAATDNGPIGNAGAVPDLTTARLVEAADLAQTAVDGLSRGDNLDPARAALALTEALLASLPGPKGDAGRTALAAAQSRLAEVRPVDRAALTQRLEALREQAVGLLPVGARLLRSNGHGGPGVEARQRKDDPVAQAAGSLDRQFQAARLAIEAVDRAGYGLAMQGIDRWVSAFYELRHPDTAAVLAQLRALAETPIAADVAPLSAALLKLAEALREPAAQTRDR